MRQVSLDLGKVASQVVSMLASLKNGERSRQEHLLKALATLQNPPADLDTLKRKISSSKTTWLVAGLTDGLAQHQKPQPVPAEFTVIAADGSHIDIDRHRSTRCYLINIGGVVLKYGSSPEAQLDSYPRLYFEDEELVVPSPTLKEREQLIEGPLLGIKRNVEELCRLNQLAAEIPAGSRALALLDGTLILWGLEAYPDFVADAMLHKAFLPCLDEMLKMRIPVASYISFPRSTDVVNVLRVALCPHDVANCDRYCSENKARECEVVAGVQDRELFSRLLDKGERSALFISPSKVVARDYGKHQVYFFYLNVDDEVARIEIPQWAALDNTMLDTIHSLVLDQCRRGQGYPVALSEAHEKAVVTGADREQFWQFVESSLVDEHMPAPTSAKSLSKRTRWI